MSTTRQIGQTTENQAHLFLQKHGLKLITRNYSCRLGELDLVMQDTNGDIVFVEVRYRKNNLFGSSAESITDTKRKKLLNTASYYLQQQHLYEKVGCRFDVIAITAKANQEVDIQWIKDAIN